MRLTKEIDNVMEVKTLSNVHYHMMYRQLESKNNVLADLDNYIMKCCEVEDIDTQVQDSDAIATKVLEYKARIELLNDL